MSPLTLYLGKFFGLSCVLLCAVLILRPRAALDAIHSMMDSPGLVLVTGLFTLGAGAATVVGHNIWSGGVLPVMVTVLGWLMLIKGVMLTAVPPDSLRAFYRVVQTPERFRMVLAVDLALSLWLAWLAFSA